MTRVSNSHTKWGGPPGPRPIPGSAFWVVRGRKRDQGIARGPGGPPYWVWLLFICGIIASAAPLDLSQWKYRKRIAVTPGDGLAVVKLDLDVYSAVGEQPWNLRVVRDSEEVPFVFETPGREEEYNPQPVEMFDRVVVPGVGIQFTLHGTDRPKTNRVGLVTDLKNFRARVRIETSPDGKRWSIARNDGAIFNFSQDGREFSSTTVECPDSRQPFIRVTVFGWTKIDSIKSAALVSDFVPKTPAYQVLVTLTPQVSEDSATNSTIVMLDLGQNRLPITRYLLETTSPQFHRAVGVETSDDLKTWTYSGSTTIRRLPGPHFVDQSLVLPGGWHSRYIRFRIYNLNDKPIQVGTLSAEGLVHQIRFLAKGVGPYWLYYGNPVLNRTPEYDLKFILAMESHPEQMWSLEPPQANPAYRPPSPPRKPWSEQHPAILYTVLGGAVLALGIATFRFASRLKPTS